MTGNFSYSAVLNNRYKQAEISAEAVEWSLETILRTQKLVDLC